MTVLVMLGFIVLMVVAIALTRGHQRYKEPGEGLDERNMVEFGQPAKSLYTTSKIFTLHHLIDITNETGVVAYRAETKFPSIHDKTDIFTFDDKHVAHIERKLISLHQVHYIDMEDGISFALSNEIFHIVRDVTNIEGLGWVMEGNFLQLNFTLRDMNGELIAVFSQKMFSMHDKYSVDIYKPEFEQEVVAILITLQHMIRDREVASSGGSSASSDV